MRARAGARARPAWSPACSRAFCRREPSCWGGARGRSSTWRPGEVLSFLVPEPAREPSEVASCRDARLGDPPGARERDHLQIRGVLGMLAGPAAAFVAFE